MRRLVWIFAVCKCSKVTFLCRRFLYFLILSGTDSRSGRLLSQIYFVFLQKKGVYSNRKEFAPLSKRKEFAPPRGANSFLLEQVLFRRDLICWRVNKQSQKLSPLYKLAECLLSASSPLKGTKIPYQNA